MLNGPAYYINGRCNVAASHGAHAITKTPFQLSALLCRCGQLFVTEEPKFMSQITRPTKWHNLSWGGRAADGLFQCDCRELNKEAQQLASQRLPAPKWLIADALNSDWPARVR